MNAVTWEILGSVVFALVTISGAVVGLVKWANRHIVRPLGAVTGHPASPGVEGVPSMLDRVAEVKRGLDHNTEVTEETSTIVKRLSSDHDQLVSRVGAVETVVAEVKGKIEGHLAGHLPKQ